MTTLELETMPSNSWAYIETDLCNNCGTPDELYANSWVKNYVLCVKCMVRRIDSQVYASSDPRADRYAQHAKETEPVINLDRCHSCLGVELKGSYEFVEALDAHQQIITVHSRCTVDCGECSQTFSRWRFNSSARHMNFMTICGESMCETCAEVRIDEDNLFLCPSCDNYESEYDSSEYDGETYCQSCYDNNVYHCDDCGESVWDGSGHDCDPSGGLVNDYSYKPRPHFFGEAKYHMGFELEVESRGYGIRTGAEIVHNGLGERIYLKNDGSLNDGFEIVTHPHSLEEYHNNFKWDTLDKLRMEGFRSWNTGTCGIHVHVSRTAFGTITTRQDISKVQAHELRFMKLIYDNERQISRLAGRTSSYASFSEKGSLVSKVKYGNSDGRYAAINCENSETLEVRVFRGSLKPKRVLSAIELVHASVEYTRDLHVSATNKALSWMKFTHFIVEHMDTYPNLADILEDTFSKDEVTSNEN